MSTYDVSLDDLAGRKVQRKRLGVGYARMHPYDQPRGRGPPPGLQARLGTAGRGKSRSSQLSRQDLRLTKLGLSTKKTDALAKGKFDLRQKLGGKETGQTSFRQITQGVVRSTFSKALEETYSTKEKKQTRLITRPLSPVRGNIKVTIKGLGKPEAAKPLHVDRTRDGSRQVASGVTYRAWEFQDKPKTAMFSSRQSQLPRLHYEDIDPAESPPPPAAPAPVQRPMFTERYTEERRRPAALMSGTKLIVSNLQPSVSHEDVVDLFTDVGEVQSVKFIKNGISEIVYFTPEDAEAAFKKYHNRNLDGQPMIIQVGMATASLARPVSSRSQPMVVSTSYRGEYISARDRVH